MPLSSIELFLIHTDVSEGRTGLIVTKLYPGNSHCKIGAWLNHRAWELSCSPSTLVHTPIPFRNPQSVGWMLRTQWKCPPDLLFGIGQSSLFRATAIAQKRESKYETWKRSNSNIFLKSEDCRGGSFVQMGFPLPSVEHVAVMYKSEGWI